jgi:hypothetical protein
MYLQCSNPDYDGIQKDLLTLQGGQTILNCSHHGQPLIVSALRPRSCVNQNCKLQCSWQCCHHGCMIGVCRKYFKDYPTQGTVFLHPTTDVNLDQADDDSILSVPGQEQIKEDEDDDFVPSVDLEFDEENSFSSHGLLEKEEDDLDWSINVVSHDDDDDPFEIGSLDSDY